jgi:methyl-accepting chemotaxis protein
MTALRWRNFRISFKYGIAFFATIVFFVIASCFVTISLFQIKDALSTIDLTAERSIDLTHMTSLFREKQLIIMDYSNFPRESLIDEYTLVEKEYSDIEARIEPKMDTDDLMFLFDRVKKNNEEMDNIFINTLVPYMQENNRDAALDAIVKASSFRIPTVQLFKDIKAEVDKLRELKMQLAYRDIENSIRMLLISVILAIALGSIIVYIISRSISGNLNRVVSLADKISVGELNVEPLKYNGRDEIGRLSGSINKMLYKLQEMIGEITESSCKVDEESKSLMEIASEVQQRSGQIAATMEEMSAGAEEQASSASEIANSIFNFTDLIDNANTNKEALQVSSEDISAVIAEGSEQMEASIETMNHVNEILKGTVSNVKQLENNSEKISVLVHIINDIAEQTNLLALNAAIEAARAGEVGKGFAVVADEIGKLAEQVAKSVKEIKDIVTGIQVESKSMADSLEKGYQSVQEGTTGIKSAGEVFVRINTEINTMAERIKNVAMNLDEISQNSKKINTAADQIAAISEENSAGIQETVASIEEENSSMEIITENANSLANSAQLLKQLVGQFKI